MRTLYLLAAGALAIQTVCSAADELIFKDDFSSPSKSWNVGESSAGTIAVIADPERGPEKNILLAHLPDSTDRLTAVSPPFGPISRTSSQTYVIRFSLRVNSPAVNVTIGFFDSQNSSQMPLRIRASGNGEISAEYWDGRQNAKFVLVEKYEPDTPYRFSLTTRPLTGVYSADVNDGPTRLTDQPFARTQHGEDIFKQINRIQIINNGGRAQARTLDAAVGAISISVDHPGKETQ